MELSLARNGGALKSVPGARAIARSGVFPGSLSFPQLFCAAGTTVFESREHCSVILSTGLALNSRKLARTPRLLQVRLCHGAEHAPGQRNARGALDATRDATISVSRISYDHATRLPLPALLSRWSEPPSLVRTARFMFSNEPSSTHHPPL